MKRMMVGCVASVALLAGTAAFASADKQADQTSAQASQTSAQANQTSANRTQAVTGVVTRIDTGKGMLTVVAPSGNEVDITTIGKTVFVDRGVDLVSVQAPIGHGVQIWRDGKQASLSSLKEGDVVRTNFDPAGKSFSMVNAVSSRQIDEDVSQAQSQLKKEVDSQLAPKGGAPAK
jgi:Cu/Ag efflux protein CusF